MDKQTTMVLVAVAVVAVVVMSSRRADAAPQRPTGDRRPRPYEPPAPGGIAGTGVTGADVGNILSGFADLVGSFFGGDDTSTPTTANEDLRRCFEYDASGKAKDTSPRCIQARNEYYGADPSDVGPVFVR